MQNSEDMNESCCCHPSSPWLSSSLAAPTAVAPVTFASIVEEERQQEAALIRSREKPLALIQVRDTLAGFSSARTALCFNPRPMGLVVICCIFEAMSNSLVQAGLELLAVFLPLPSKCHIIGVAPHPSTGL